MSFFYALYLAIEGWELFLVGLIFNYTRLKLENYAFHAFIYVILESFMHRDLSPNLLLYCQNTLSVILESQD